MPTTASAGDHISLRVLDIADVACLVEGLNDWGIAQWLPAVPFPYREEDARTFIAETMRTSPPAAYVVTDSATGQFLGVIGLSRNGDMAELGYWLLARHHGKGFMREAIERLLARQDRRFVSVFATVDPKNAPSMKLLEKTGFRLVGEHLRSSPNRQGNLVVLRYERALG